MANKHQPAGPAYEAIGRVARALTYPLISGNHDLSLRELNALATIAHINDQMDVSSSASEVGRVDTFDAMMMVPGTARAFFEEAQFIEATDKLATLGLVAIEATQGPRLLLKMAKGPSRIVRLTDAGREMLDAMAGNLAKSLDVLDDKDVRQDLALYS